MAMSSYRVLASKAVSYGLVLLVEWGGMASLRYGILVNDVIKAQSNDLTFLTNEFNNKYW
jgi:hypothetical protein